MNIPESLSSFRPPPDPRVAALRLSPIQRAKRHLIFGSGFQPDPTHLPTPEWLGRRDHQAFWRTIRVDSDCLGLAEEGYRLSRDLYEELACLDSGLRRNDGSSLSI